METNNITEDYVSFETAKLLKEKGFNERLLTFYITDKSKKEGCFQQMAFTDKIDNTHSNYCYLAPTIQMAIKWLRIVHNFEIYPSHDNFQEHHNWWFDIGKFSKGYSDCLYESDPIYPTYELACDAAIQYCLENLI